MVEIIEVKSLKQRKEFVEFPNILYKDEPNYIPALFSDSLATITPEKNKAFEFCEARFWIAKKEGKMVGRIGAIINYRANEKWNKKQMRFWNVDFIDDTEVSTILFELVEKWAKEKDCTEIVGPLGFTDLDPEGMLVDGFNERGLFVTYYNYPYYVKNIEKLGYEKDADWVEYIMECPENKEEYAKISRMAELFRKRYKLHIREFLSVKDFDDIAPDIMNMINTAYEELYCTSELDEEQRKNYYKAFKSVLSTKSTIVVYNELQELVGFVVAIPDISKAIKKSNGKLFPFGWFRILRALKKNDEYISLLIGVRPDYRKRGALPILLERIYDSAVDLGVKKCRICPMLEDNIKVLGIMKAMPSRIYKRRRSYIKHL